MNDWQNILRELNEESPMDFCKEFTEVKSVLEHCNNYVQCYVNLNNGNGIENLLNEIKTRMQAAFVRWGYLTEDLKPLPNAYPIFRKIVMLLILNTDITYHVNLKEDNNVAHVVNLYPPLPKFLLVLVIWELQLECIFYETITNTPIWLTFPLMEEVLNSLNNSINEYEIMEKGEHIISAMFSSLTSAQHDIHNSTYSTQQNTEFCEMTITVVKRALDMPRENTNQDINDVRWRGYRIKHILHTLSFAINAYLNVAMCKSSSEMEFYKIFQRQKSTPVCEDRHSCNADIVELQLKIFHALLDALENNISELPNNILLSWMDICAPNGNLRYEIGKLAYNLNENVISLDHSVFKKLDVISLRLDSTEEKLRKSTLNDIITYLSSGENNVLKKPWFDEFLNRHSSIDIVKYVEVIRQHQALMSFDNCKAILSYMSEHFKQVQSSNQSNQFKEMESHSNNYMKLGSTMLATLTHCSNYEIIDILCYQRELFGEDVCICQGNDFGFRSTEFLNKEFDLTTFLLLCIENPSQMWKKYFAIEFYSSAHIANFCETVEVSNSFSEEYFIQYLNELLMEPHRVQQKQFPSFLCEIYFKLYNQRKMCFLKEFIYKSVTKYIALKDFRSLLPFVYTLNKISNHGESHSVKRQNFGEITAPVLVMTVQILECARWDFNTYTEIRDKLVQETINFICATSKKFLPVASQKDRKWIANYISNNSSNLSQYYFQKFSLSKDIPPQSFEDFMIPEKPANTDEEKTLLLYLLVHLTGKETELLLRTDLFLPHLASSLIILGKHAEKIESLNNYKNCIVNYANFIQKTLLPRYEKEDDLSKIKELLMNILRILKFAPDAAYATLFLDLENLLISLSKKALFLQEQQQTLAQIVIKMKDCNAKNLYLKKLETLHDEI